MWRLIPGSLLLLGFPAWFVWWLQSPNVLTYLYAVTLYAAATAILVAWGFVSQLR